MFYSDRRLSNFDISVNRQLSATYYMEYSAGNADFSLSGERATIVWKTLKQVGLLMHRGY